MRPSRRFMLLALSLYGLGLVALVYGLTQSRRWASQALSTGAARQEWQEFRDDVAAQTDTGSPVRRRVPRSSEPPALVLLRDHFATCTTSAIVLTSALYWTAMLFVAGALAAAPPAPATDDAG